MRAVQVTRMLRTLAAAPSSLEAQRAGAPIVCQQQSSSRRCRRSASTESFAWSVGSEPTGASAGSGAREGSGAAGEKPKNGIDMFIENGTCRENL